MADATLDYPAFLARKFVAAAPAGFKVDPGTLPEALFPFQREIVAWACRLGRAALFADTGLGKTLMQLAWGRAVADFTRGRVLVLTPLAVGRQTVAEAARFGVRGVFPAASQDEASGHGLYVTNYQKLHLFDPARFDGVVLDESSILKNFTGKTRQALTAAFARTPYRLACTATPAPNDHLELGNHAEFLGVMPANEMLMRWFINDPAHAGEYRLKRHAEADYWRWVASWACCVSRPSDLGYPDAGYDLPPLEVLEHTVAADLAPEGGRLVRADKLTATTLHREKRRTAAGRAARVAELVAAEPAEPWLVWCDTDYEADALAEAVPGAVEVRGSMSDARKEDGLAGFTAGRHRVLVTKPDLAGFGLNWQHCARVAFVGVSYSWERFYQAVRRCWRYGQARPVACHVVLAEGEHQVLAELKRKQRDNDAMRAAMVGAVRAAWRESQDRKGLVMDYEPTIAEGPGWLLRLGDCVEEVAKLEPDTVGLSVFSPPFGNLYVYSDSARDMGNAADDAEFFRHFGFLVPELYRVTVPGRLAVVHCKDLPTYRNRDGACGLKDFPGECVRLFEAHGWVYHSRVTIWKCPVTERERTNNNGLLHATAVRDSTQCRQGMADYLLVFRKNPEGGNLSAAPVERPAGFTEWVGDPAFDPRNGDAPHPSKFARKPGRRPRLVDLPDGTTADLTPSVNVWQRYADPVWWDIDQRDVLNYQLGRADKDEKHICPLQLGVIARAVELWSNPGDLVLSPFAGVGSEGHQALLMHRRFVGVELKRSYFDVAAKNLAAAARKAAQKDLFAAVGVE